MIRSVYSFPKFAKSKPFSVHNIFNQQTLREYTSLDQHSLSSLLDGTNSSRQKWTQLPDSRKEEDVRAFTNKLSSSQTVTECSRLLSASTGKQMVECQAELKTAIQIFKHQIGSNYHQNSPFGKSGFRFQPFDFLVSIFDHRHPLLSAFSYLALALRTNNALLLRPSPQVLPPVEFITSLWDSCSDTPIIRCLVDAETDPKHDDSPVLSLLNQTQGFLHFSGRLKEGLDFHYFMSQTNEVFRESEFLLTSSDSVYVMKDLSESQLAAAAVVVGRACFSNCGHNFNSVKRVFVDRQVRSQFEQLLLQQAQLYTIDPSILQDFSKVEVNEGKLAPFPREAEFLESQRILQDIKGNSGKEIKLIQGGEQVVLKSKDSTLHYMMPAVFRVETDFPSFNYQYLECMMPISFLVSVDSPDNCVQKINSSIFGTTASLFTNQFSIAEALAPRLQVGTVNLNTWEVTTGVTYSGRKRSGKGFSLSPLSFNNAVRTKSLSFP